MITDTAVFFLYCFSNKLSYDLLQNLNFLTFKWNSIFAVHLLTMLLER